MPHSMAAVSAKDENSRNPADIARQV